MNPNLRTPEIRHDDPDHILKEELIAAARKGGHCPRDVCIFSRIERFIDKDAPEFDQKFHDDLRTINDTWFYDLGYDPETDYQQKRTF